ncbi:hypothetical protein JTE90_004558 [Oedothorax gibbosus]|uniref:Uncharacterized protein n=1 Tax=Oedothorax gibbosus TaxID=931172 RepID=A0AAV6UJI8_9ARAC|nr:hypothetical protein JTE90_004558 [Oedothorax gibbosus]
MRKLDDEKDLKDLLEETELNYWKWCCENYPQRYSKQEIYDLMNVKDTVYNTVMLKKAAFRLHIMDADKKSWLRKVMDWEPDGVRNRVGPKEKWMYGLEDFLNSFRNYQIYFQKKQKTRKHNMFTNSGNANVQAEEEKGNEESVLQL